MNEMMIMLELHFFGDTYIILTFRGYLVVNLIPGLLRLLSHFYVNKAFIELSRQYMSHSGYFAYTEYSAFGSGCEISYGLYRVHP